MIPLEVNVIHAVDESALTVHARHPGMTIIDGRGGSLTLDLARPELHWLAEACERLADGNLPPNASVLKVHAAGQVYLLARHSHADHAPEISISNLFDPGERVVLTEDTARLATNLIRLVLAEPDTRE